MIKQIFLGPNGLRAGWRFLLFVVGIILLGRFATFPLANYLVARFRISTDELSAPAMIFSASLDFVTLLVVTGLAALFDRRRIDSYGLPVRQAFGLYFWKGMLAAFFVILFVAGGMLLARGMQIQGLALSGSELLIN